MNEDVKKYIWLALALAIIGYYAVPVIEYVSDNGGQVFNCRAYGCTGNGATDDMTAIQNTLNAADTVNGTALIPPSVNSYVVSDFITIPLGVTLKGEGGATIKFTGTGDGACTAAQTSPVNTGFIRFPTPPSGSARITGLNLVDTGTASSSCLINLQNGGEVSGVEIDHDNLTGSSSTTETNIAIYSYSNDTVYIHDTVLKDWAQMIVGGAHTWANVNIGPHNVISTGSNNSLAMISTPGGLNCFQVSIFKNVFEGYGTTNGISSTCSNGMTIEDNYFGDSSSTGGTWIQTRGTLIDNYISAPSNGKGVSGSFIAIGNWFYGTNSADGTYVSNTFSSGGACYDTVNQGSIIESIGNNFGSGSTNSYCNANSLTPHPIVREAGDVDSTTSGIHAGITVNHMGTIPTNTSSIPACTADIEGETWQFLDSTSNTAGATIVGGGTNHVLGACSYNGSTYNWIVGVPHP